MPRCREGQSQTLPRHELQPPPPCHHLADPSGSSLAFMCIGFYLLKLFAADSLVQLFPIRGTVDKVGFHFTNIDPVSVMFPDSGV